MLWYGVFACQHPLWKDLFLFFSLIQQFHLHQFVWILNFMREFKQLKKGKERNSIVGFMMNVWHHSEVKAECHVNMGSLDCLGSVIQGLSLVVQTILNHWLFSKFLQLNQTCLVKILRKPLPCVLDFTIDMAPKVDCEGLLHYHDNNHVDLHYTAVPVPSSRPVSLQH